MLFPRLQYITDDPLQVEKACKAGIEWVQIRVKDKDEETWEEIANDCVSICKKFGVYSIINDHPQIALRTKANGVHLGLNDMPVSEAREIFGKTTMLIGATANRFEDVLNHIHQGCDYIGCGPFRHTETKKNLSPVLGLEGYEDIFKNMIVRGVFVPVFAIGGIVVNDVDSLMRTGTYGVAVSSALTHAADMKTEISLFNHYLSNEIWTTS
jgi:thiamine-phosphate pyrophosphorylase